MMLSVSAGIDVALSELDTAMAVLEATIEYTDRLEAIKLKTTEGAMLLEEIQYLRKLMGATFHLLSDPVNSLTDIQGTAQHLVREEGHRGTENA